MRTLNARRNHRFGVRFCKLKYHLAGLMMMFIIGKNYQMNRESYCVEPQHDVALDVP